MDPLTPQALLDLYWMLPKEGQIAFLKLLGRISCAEVPFLITNELNQSETFRFSEMVFTQIAYRTFPILLREARRIAQESPGISDNDFDKELDQRVRHLIEEQNRVLGELERAQLKDKRDRKSDPETVRRYVEICNLRRRDPKTWSMAKLARKYDMKRQSIDNILKEESKWRSLLAAQSSSKNIC